MKRILTLIGSIAGIVYSAVSSTLTLIFFMALWAFLNGVGALVIVIGIIASGFGIATLVLDVMSARSFSCRAEQYAKRRKLLVTAAIFNFIPSLILLLVIFAGMVEIYLLLPVMAMGVAASVLIIVDLHLEKRRVEKTANTTSVEYTAPTTLPNE